MNMVALLALRDEGMSTQSIPKFQIAIAVTVAVVLHLLWLWVLQRLQYGLQLLRPLFFFKVAQDTYYVSNISFLSSTNVVL